MIIKDMKHSRLLFGVVAATLLVTGCGGGIIGTATGPGTGDDIKPTYRLKSFPSKLGPKIPKTLQADNTQVLANPDTGVSRSWQQLSPSVTHAEATRVLVQEVLTLLDTVFATALESCEEGEAVCIMPAGTVQAQYTQDVIDQLQVLVGYDSSNDATTNSDAPYQDLLGSWITFGEIEYEKLSNDLYNHYLVIDSVALLDDRILELEWTDDASDISYAVLSDDDTGISEYYRYQNGANGQHLNFHWSTESDDELDPITFELNADIEDTGPVSYSAYLNGQKISGRASELEGYASAMLYEQSGDTSQYFQESFSLYGELIDTRDCDDTFIQDVDCSFDEFESSIYIAESVFDELESDYDFDYAEVIVSNVPTTIFEFEVRQRSTSVNENATAVYCHGFQYPAIPPASETFCFVEPEELIDPVVVGFDEFGREILIEDAVVEILNSDD